MNFKKSPLSIALAATLFAGANAYAESWALEEVMVTAQKRAESAQDVPVAISAFSEDMIVNTGADGIGDIIAMVPGLTGTTTVGSSLNFWAIRGIASNDFTVGAEPSVGTYIDDAYIGRNIHSLSAFFDVDRIEVVKGPQGTLFGRNAAAGAISIITNKPEHENAAKVGLSAGNEGQREYDLMGNLDVNDNFALRIAYHGSTLDGVMEDNVSGDEGGYDKNAARLSALWDVTEDFAARLTLNYGESKTTVINGSYTPFMQQFNDNGIGSSEEYPDEIGLSSENKEQIYSDGADLRLTWDVNDSLTFTSITDYRSFDMDFITDQDGSQADDAIGALFGTGVSLQWFQPAVLQESYSQEFRLNGNSGAIDWFVGASYFKEDVNETQILSLLDIDNGFAPIFGASGDIHDTAKGDGETESLGVYGDVKYAVTDKLSLTAGVRWSQDEKDWCSIGINNTNLLGMVSTDLDFDGNSDEICGSEKWDEITSRFVVDYAITDDILAYASYSEGYKGGGFNMPAASTDLSDDLILDATFAVVGTLADRDVDLAAGESVYLTANEVSSFEPETSQSYELGIKSAFLDNTLQFNAAAFLVEFKDLQIQNTTVAGIITSNAAESETQGIEFDFIYAATENLVVMGNYTYLDAEFKSGIWNTDGSDLKGRSLAFAPEKSYSIAVDYSVDVGAGALSLFSVYNWTDDYHNQSDNAENLVQEDYGLWNAKLTYTPGSEAWNVFASVDNIEDKGYSTWKQDIGLGLDAGIYRGMPRLWKVGFNTYF